MKLSIEQIRKITKGAVRVQEEKDGVHFYRLTKEQEDVYKNIHPDFYQKTLSTAGVRMEFQTNSKTLFIKAITSESVSRLYFSFDIFVNGELNGYMDNFSNVELPEKYPNAKLPLGTFEKTFLLGEGEKRVCIHFPWSVVSVIEEISLEDGAFVEPVKSEKKMLVYGDSITHGYDALRPSHRYASRIADAIGAEEINKAVGGEQFFPELAEKKDDFVPDYIMVAYGTNDWDSTTEEIVREHCEGFYSALVKNYPNTPIFALTPVWRKNYSDYRVFGEFSKVDKLMRESLKAYKNITVISGFDFIPKDINYYADRVVHPNDAGFEHYFNNLYKEIEKII